MKRVIKRGTALLLSLTLAISTIPISAWAAEPVTEKEEVVYINLTSAGDVSEVNVVNIFDLAAEGSILDHGGYTSVRNMTGTEELHQNGDTVTADLPAGKLYYEGRLDGAEIPFAIAIRYYLDGEEYSGEEIAGKSGHLRLTMDISKNEKCKGSFFDSYALQCTMQLDTAFCKNIVSDSATMANVGSKKQLTYTILPGKGAAIEVTADVTDFEMEGIAINGIPLNLSIEVDDEELMGKVTELMDAIEQLDDGASALNGGVGDLNKAVSGELNKGVSALDKGANKLKNGAAELKNGGSALNDGAKVLQKGADSLSNGIGALNEGILEISKGLDTLNGNSSTLTDGSGRFKDALVQLQTAVNGISVNTDKVGELVDASTQIKEGISTLTENLVLLESSVSFDAYSDILKEKGLDVEELQANNAAAAKTLKELTDKLNKALSILKKVGIDIAPINDLAAKLSDLPLLLNANNAFISGTDTYLTKANEGISELVKGAETLKGKYGEFDEVIGMLADTLVGMIDQLGTLKTAVNTLVMEYEKLDKGIGDYTEGVAKLVAGYSEVVKGSQALVKGSDTLKNGTDTLYSGTAELLNGISELYDGTGTLKDGTGKLDDGVGELLAGIRTLRDGSEAMKDGTGTLRSETAGMDDQINEKIDELLASVTGGELAVESFVSQENKNVTAVQFVVKTPAIEAEEETAEETIEDGKLTFWEKLLRLFGVGK